jgi:NAD(P)-dependent dehydrogenase (short-subunit alcohol dehydrogenase family)
MAGPLDLFDLTGKTALITGASYGLGVSFAEALAAQGADVHLTARSAELLEGTRAQIEGMGRKATATTGDVANPDDVAKVVAECIEHHGKVDILVNNAGISDLRGLPSEHSDAETFKRIIDVDLMGVWYFAQACGRHMLAQNSGSIVNISSILGNGGSEFVNPWYYAAKGAVIQLTKLLAVEWGDRNVRVNALSPGYVLTEMTRPVFEMLGMAPWIESRTPMRRLCEVQDLIGPLLLLSSNAGAYVSGMNLTVDGAYDASRGAWQMPPSHFMWNKDQPQIGTPYPGLVPNTFEHWHNGIPGIHYPMPEA